MPTANNTINNTVIDGLSAQNKNLPSVGNATSNKILRTLHFLTSKVTSDILNAAYYGQGEISYTRDYIEKDLNLDLSTFITFLVSRGYDVYTTDINNKALDEANIPSSVISLFKYGKIGYSLINFNYTDPNTGETDVPDNRRYLPKFAYGVTNSTYPNDYYYSTIYNSRSDVGDSLIFSYDNNENNIIIRDRYYDYIYYININFGKTSSTQPSTNKSPVQYSLEIE